MSSNPTIQEAYDLISRFNAANWENSYLQSTGAIKNKCALSQTCFCRTIRCIFPRQFLKSVFKSDLETGIEKIIAAVNQVVADGAHLVGGDLQQFIDETSTKISRLEQKALGVVRVHILPQAPSLQEDSETEVTSPQSPQNQTMIVSTSSDPENIADPENERDQSVAPTPLPSPVAPTSTLINQESPIPAPSTTITSTSQKPSPSTPKADKKKEKADKKKEKTDQQVTKKKKRKGVNFNFLNLGHSKTTSKDPNEQK